jgi:hypothetical protein
MVGTTCEVVDGDAVCTPIEPPFCGGFGNIQCPGAGTCVDDTSDGCDPENGGADCGGVCECDILALCIEGFVFDASPEVCGCVEAPPSAPFCGGFGNIQCPGAGTCVDDPSDGCDPENGGADCGGVCECNILALCIEGFEFDASPEVCACVEAPELDPCAVVRCEAGFQCIVVDGSASCESPCNLVDCIPDTICKVVEGEAMCVPCD